MSRLANNTLPKKKIFLEALRFLKLISEVLSETHIEESGSKIIETESFILDIKKRLICRDKNRLESLLEEKIFLGAPRKMVIKTRRFRHKQIGGDGSKILR